MRSALIATILTCGTAFGQFTTNWVNTGTGGSWFTLSAATWNPATRYGGIGSSPTPPAAGGTATDVVVFNTASTTITQSLCAASLTAVIDS